MEHSRRTMRSKLTTIYRFVLTFLFLVIFVVEDFLCLGAEEVAGLGLADADPDVDPWSLNGF